jgi:hypothetical protein
MGIERDEELLAKEMSRSEDWQRVEQEFLPEQRRTREEYWAQRRTSRNLSDEVGKATTRRRGLGFNPWFPAAPRRRRGSDA